MEKPCLCWRAARYMRFKPATKDIKGEPSICRRVMVTQQTSRRNFLGLSALGLAAAVAPGDLLQPAAAASDLGNEHSRIGSEISVWVTSGDQRFAVAPQATWRAAAPGAGADQLHLDPATKFQE